MEKIQFNFSKFIENDVVFQFLEINFLTVER